MKDNSLNLYEFVNMIAITYYKNYENIDDIKQAGYEAIITSPGKNQEGEILAAMKKESRFFKSDDRLFHETESHEDIESNYLKQEFWELVESILSDKEYEVIHMVFVENKTHGDIAKKLNVSQQRIAAIKQTALTKLREQRRFFE